MKLGAVIPEYFAGSLQPEDLRRLKVQSGSCGGQQELEALAVVAALRLWKDKWSGKRCTIAVNADNMTALVMTATLKGKGGAIAFLARWTSRTASTRPA